MALTEAEGFWQRRAVVWHTQCRHADRSRLAARAEDPGWQFRKGNVNKRGIFLLILSSALVCAGFGQTSGATVRGVVSDRSGSVCVAARVALVNEETNERRETVGGADGTFLLTVLPPGPYRVEADLAGFRRYVGREFGLQVGQDVRG